MIPVMIPGMPPAVPEHFSGVLAVTGVEAALAAGIFDRREVPISAVKEHLKAEGVEIR